MSKFLIALVAIAVAHTTTAYITCGPCSAEECGTFTCGSVDPFVCTAGTARSGCSHTATAWEKTALCTSCCDLSGCPSKQPTTIPPVSCPKCTATQCERTRCPAEDPFACVAGHSDGGCAATPAGWNNPALCSECCDASACSGPMPPPPTKADFHCKGMVCSKAECESTKRCGVDVPYMCTGGKTPNGCTANATYWPNSGVCSSCCDVTTCEVPCGTCSAEECKMTMCTASNPYMCTSGPESTGCSALGNYFPQQSQCYSCCDVQKC